MYNLLTTGINKRSNNKVSMIYTITLEINFSIALTKVLNNKNKILT